MELHQVKIFITAKQILNKINRQPTEPEKIVPNYATDRGFISTKSSRNSTAT